MRVVVIVDDDAAIRTALARLVRTIGYRPVTFASGDDLLRRLEEVEAACVLTDIQMPGMSGLVLTQHLRRRQPTLPILVMTAYPSQTNRDQALASGAQQYLAKPLDDQTLEEWLLNAIGTPERR